MHEQNELITRIGPGDAVSAAAQLLAAFRAARWVRSAPRSEDGASPG